MTATRTKKRRVAPHPNQRAGISPRVVTFGFVAVTLAALGLGWTWAKSRPSAQERELQAEFGQIDRKLEQERARLLTAEERERNDRFADTAVGRGH